MSKIVSSKDEPLEQFTILLVEDKPKAVQAEVKSVEDHVKTTGLRLKVINNLDGKGIAAELKKHLIDIVVTDKNLTETKDGFDVLRAIDKSGSFTDALLYSAGGVNADQIPSDVTYQFVEVVDGKAFAEPLIKLIDKNLRRWGDIVLLRGVVISKIIELELRINSLFERFFKIQSSLADSFHNYILESSGNTLEGKIRSLQNIMAAGKVSSDKEFQSLLSDLRDLQKQRNYLAHCKRDSKSPNCLVSMGESKKFDRKKTLSLFQKAKDCLQTIDALDMKLNGPIN